MGDEGPPGLPDRQALEAMLERARAGLRSCLGCSRGFPNRLARLKHEHGGCEGMAQRAPEEPGRA